MKIKIYPIVFMVVFLTAVFIASPLVYSVTKTSPPAGDKTQGDIPFNDAAGTIYNITGNLTLTGNNTGVAGASGVVFVSGNLNINSNYCYGATDCLTSTLVSNTVGAVFIVKGNINIATSVTRIDAVLISEGIIRTATQSDVGVSGYTNPATTGRLVINGSLVSLNTIDTCPTNCPIKFLRALADNSIPAEKVNYQVKYLVLMRNLVSDTYQKWSEL